MVAGGVLFDVNTADVYALTVAMATTDAALEHPSPADAVVTKYPGLAAVSAWYFEVHGYVATAVCTWGLMANLANIVILTRKSMLSPTNFILTWLALADLLTMLSYIPFALHFYVMRDRRIGFPSTVHVGWIRLLAFHVNFAIVCHTVAIWLTITLAVCRYLCIRYPTRGTAMCSLANVKMAVAAVYMTSVVACVPNYLVRRRVQIAVSFQICASCNPSSFGLLGRREG